jgi:hypothetical protein
MLPKSYIGEKTIMHLGKDSLFNQWRWQNELWICCRLKHDPYFSSSMKFYSCALKRKLLISTIAVNKRLVDIMFYHPFCDFLY